MAQILIVGCGEIGSALGLRLAAKKHEVWGLRRRSHLLPGVIQGIGADLSDSECTPELPRDLDFIFIITTADRFEEAAYRRAYLEVSRNVVRIARETLPGVRRIFFVSSTSVYGQRNAEWVDEDTPATARAFPGKVLRRAESVLLESGLPVTIVRSGGIYGPGRRRTLERVRRGAVPQAPDARQYVNLIHSSDLVAALEHLMELEAPADLYLAVDHEPVERGALFRWLASRMEAGPSPPPGPEGPASRSSGTNKRCRNQRLLDSGFKFTYPTYREGYGALLESQATPGP